MKQKVAYKFSPMYHAIKFLALEPAFWPAIDKLFNSLRPKSLVAARRHQRDGGRIIAALPHKARLRAIEMLGIDHVDHNAVNEIIYKMYRHEIDWLGKHKDHIKFSSFLHEFVKTQSSNEFEKLFIIFHMIVEFNHLDFDRENEMYNNMLLRISDSYNTRLDPINLEPSTPWMQSEAKGLQQEWLNRYKSVDSINEIQSHDELYGADCDALELLMLSEGASLMNLEELKFSKSEIRGMISAYCSSSDDAPEFEDLQFYMSPAMIVKGLAKIAVQAANDYIDLALTTETEKATTYKKQVKELTTQLAASTELAAKRQENLNAINLSCDRLKLTVADLQAERDQLRTELENMQAAMDAPEEVETEAELPFPSDKKIVVLGGNPNWQNKIAAEFPNVTTIAHDNFNFDLGIVRNADIVCFNWLYASHGQYYRLINAKIKNNIIYIANNNLAAFKAAVSKA